MATFILKNTTNSAPVTETGQLEFSTDRNTLVVGDGTNQVVIAKMDVENSGSFILTGDIRLSGSIYLGDNLANDTVNINSPFSGSIIPSGSNVFDLGSSNLKYRNVYATSISGAIAATNGVISGSSQIVGILPVGTVSGSSQIVYSNISGIPSNIVSASTDTANVDITITNGNISADLKGGVVSSSAQIIDVIGSLNTYTGSNDNKWQTLQGVTSSLITSVYNLELNSGSYARTGSNSFIGNQSVSGNLYLTGSLIPSGNFIYDLGSITNGFGDLYISSASIFMDGAKVIGSDTINLSIGDQFEGGTVFYIANDNSYVLIIDNDDLSTAIGGGTKVASASGSIIGTGESNTNAIISQTGLEQNPARKAYDSIRGNYTDWYLPSVEELYYAAIYSGRLNTAFYWSSTTGSFNYQLVRNDGYINSSGDNVNWRVRAIRKSTTISSKGLQTFTNQVISGSITMTGNINGINVSQSTNLINNRLNILENTYATTASVTSLSGFFNTFTESINTNVTNLNLYTSSLKTALDVSGQNLTVYGNLTVQGTQTTLNTNEIIIEDKTLTLASGSATAADADGAGIHIAGANVTMSWDNLNSRLLFNTGLGIIGSISSSTIVGLNGATVSAYSTSVDSRFVTLGGRVNQLEITSGAVNIFTQSVDSKFNTLASYTGSNDTLNTTQNSRLDQLSTASGSTIVRLNNLESTSASVSSSIGTINSFTSSQLSQNTQLATTTGSYNTRFTTLATVTGSYDTRFSTLASYTASNDTTNTTQNSRLDQLSTASGSAIVRLNNLETTSASVNTSISNINIATSSLNDWSASVRVNITNIHNFTASVSSSLSVIYQTTASLNSATASLFTSASLLTSSFRELLSAFNTLTQSVDPNGVSAQFENVNNRFTTIGTLTGSYDNRWNTLSQVTASLISTTASLNTFTSSQNSINSGYNSHTSSTNIRLTNVESTTSSLNTSVTNINSYTSSLRTAITVAGSDVTINGNLTVAGTTTQINSTQVNIGENILELNFGGSANRAGIYTKDATGGSTISGSLLWDATNDRWIAGVSGSEAKVLTDGMGILSGSGQLGGIYETTGRSIVSGSSQIVPLLPAGTVSGSSQVIGILTSLNSYTASNDSTNTTQNNRLSALEIETLNLESFTSSINTTIKNQLNANTVVSGSSQVIGILASLNTFTSSLDATYATEAEVAAGYEAKGRGIFSGSSQIPNASISNAQLANSAITVAGTSVSLGNSITLATITAGSGIISGSGQLGGIYETTGRGIVSGSGQIVPLLPSGVVSGSSQVSYTGLSNIPAGIISGAAQLTGDFDTRYLNTNGDGVFSSSVQIGNYVATITGTSNQVVVAGSGNNAAAITLSTPQNIHTSATPQFGSLGIGTAASGVTGEIRATGDITAFYSSDERLKENITPIQNALEKVEAISGNTYDWKDGFETIHSHKGHDLGVIAQEVQSILPEVVTERDNGYLAVDYIKLVPVLIQAVKELSAKVKELESK